MLNETYDYPPNIKETFQDLGRTVSEKVHLLSSATSTSEAQAALVAPPSAKPQPKTFSHAIARASLSSSQLLHQSHTGAGEDPLATALEKYALTMERVGEARLAQDSQIQSRFLAGWSTTLNTNLNFATRARKNVEKSRLSLDAVKAHAKGTTFKLGGHGAQAEGQEEQELSPEAQEEIEKAEDEFVTQTEEAVGVMKNVMCPVLDSPEPLRNLCELLAAQIEYHKKAYEVLSELAPFVDGLQAEPATERAVKRLPKSLAPNNLTVQLNGGLPNDAEAVLVCGVEWHRDTAALGTSDYADCPSVTMLVWRERMG
ncbi:bin/amphiphysin/Rvs domain-containingfor vesicular trafficking [Purpureocillium lilacinum]|uniref:Bin/amphiphysin/Rvs domain for vesicular trafficking n=1 Tax=Purpureocillium lilacinum TaxID=33203 RepID=A0A179HYB6_PURLI|nr:bin/amphiphysin/Rvs domain-containingfor vesicular trafficking [Purpureocillium lilacinum]OAQ86569.1 bin/amphiphysin/Rvs domain for vesicular trafficking [Purpureocillium lilacinum]OAQ94531.1 bin/amphiphysin/Rvs domain-containingfor vesicular trafficking [Purpureocillium lilacinum]